MEALPEIPETVWDDIAAASDLADALARQGRAVRFRRGSRSCDLEVELVGGGASSVRPLRPGDVIDVELLEALADDGWARPAQPQCDPSERRDSTTVASASR